MTIAEYRQLVGFYHRCQPDCVVCGGEGVIVQGDEMDVCPNFDWVIEPEPTDAAISELGLELTDLVAGDEESDGVFWAMAWELGEY